MPRTFKSSHALSATRRSSRAAAAASGSARSQGYHRLWTSLAKHALAPAVRHHLRRSYSVRRAGGAPHTSRGALAVAHDWMRPMSEIVAERRRNGRRRLSARRFQKRCGGFVLGGSVPRFTRRDPADDLGGGSFSRGPIGRNAGV